MVNHLGHRRFPVGHTEVRPFGRGYVHLHLYTPNGPSHSCTNVYILASDTLVHTDRRSRGLLSGIRTRDPLLRVLLKNEDP